MPPKVKPLSQEDEDALFDAPLFPDSANDNSDASLEGVDPDDPALFDAPLFSKDVYDPERSPSPPSEPKEWWEDILGKANEVVSTDEGQAGGWRAALQGASLNTADNLTRWASPSFADSLDQAAKDYPGSHGLGQALPRTAVAMLAGPSVVSQGMAQSGVSGLASAADGGSFKDVLGDMGLGALEGGIGAVVGKGFGAVGRAIGDTAPGKWAGRQLGRLMPGADDAARALPDSAPRRDPFVGRRGELARMPPEPVPSGPPAPSSAIGEDEAALMDLVRRKPPRSAMPEYPPPTESPPQGTWPPGYAPGKTMRGPMGRIVKRPQPGAPFEPIPERPQYGPPPATELPYEAPLSPDLPPPASPGERLLRMDAPLPPRKPATLSEPPLPVPDSPPPPPPLELAFEPGPPLRAKPPASAPYDVPLREGASSAGSAEPSLFSDVIDFASMQTPRGALRGAAAGARLGKRAINAFGGPTDPSGMATAGRVATGIGWDTGLPDLLDTKVNAQDRATQMGVGPDAYERALQSDLPPPTTVAEPDVLAMLAGNATAFGQGVGFNMVDDLFDATGQQPSADYVREQAERHPDAARTGGFLRSAIAAGLAPGTVAAQGAALGMTGAVGDYGIYGSPRGAALTGGEDAAFAGAGPLVARGVSAAGDALRRPLTRAIGGYLLKHPDPLVDPLVRGTARGLNTVLSGGNKYAEAPGMRVAAQAAYHRERRDAEADAALFTPVEERASVADAPTLHYALQATLAGGRAGLSPEDERALTEAVVAGDQKAISATDFRLRQRYPAYARAVERELRSYNEED